MKTIKNSLRILFFVIFSCMVLSCKKENMPAKPEPSVFTVSLEGNMPAIPAAGGTANIIINSGSNGWWITVPPTNWVVINKTYGSGDFKLPVTIKANTTGAPRTVEIKINPTFNLPAVSVTLNQDK